MEIPRAIALLSQMYLPQFDDEEKEALTMAINALNHEDFEENARLTLVEDTNKPCRCGFYNCDNKYKWCVLCKEGSHYFRKSPYSDLIKP